MLRRHLPAACALLALLAVAPGSAFASGSFQTWGPHLGFSTDPSQVVFGGQLEAGNIAPQIDFVPGVDLGVGDNVTLVTLYGDFRYRLKVTGATWQPYVGGGVALHFISVDNGTMFSDGDGTRAGGTLLVGADVPTKTGNRFFVEGKFALGDGPTFKALAGWNFPLR